MLTSRIVSRPTDESTALFQLKTRKIKNMLLGWGWATSNRRLFARTAWEALTKRLNGCKRIISQGNTPRSCLHCGETVMKTVKSWSKLDDHRYSLVWRMRMCAILKSQYVAQFTKIKTMCISLLMFVAWKHVGHITFVLIEMGYTLTLVYKSHVAFEFIISNVVKMKLCSGLCYVSFEKQFDILTFGKPRECIYFFF